MKKLRLSHRDRKIFGVCGGLAEHLDIDANLVRILAIPLLFLTGIFPLIITYVAAWLILPEGPERLAGRRTVPVESSTTHDHAAA